MQSGDSWWTAEDCSGVFGDGGPRGRWWRRSAMLLRNDDYRCGLAFRSMRLIPFGGGQVAALVAVGEVAGNVFV